MQVISRRLKFDFLKMVIARTDHKVHNVATVEDWDAVVVVFVTLIGVMKVYAMELLLFASAAFLEVAIAFS